MFACINDMPTKNQSNLKYVLTDYLMQTILSLSWVMPLFHSRGDIKMHFEVQTNVAK